MAPNNPGIQQGQRRVQHNWHIEPGAALHSRAPGPHGGNHHEHQQEVTAPAPAPLHIEHGTYDPNHFVGSNPIHRESESAWQQQQQIQQQLHHQQQQQQQQQQLQQQQYEESRNSFQPRPSGLTGKGVVAAPDNISDELWSEVKTAQGDRWAAQFADFANWTQTPQGFNDAALWEKMSEKQKQVFLTAENELRYGKKRCINDCPGIGDSHVGRFFLDFDADDFNFDAGINAFALLNALVLTIPYGCIMNLNGEFFDQLHNAWEACDPNKANMASISLGETAFHNYIIRNLSVANYGAISGLIMATLYYVFKPTDSTGLTRWSKKKIRLLVMSIFICTVAAIFGIMLAWASIIQVYSRRASEYCELNPAAESMWRSGTAAIVLSLFTGFYLMW